MANRVSSGRVELKDGSVCSDHVTGSEVHVPSTELKLDCALSEELATKLMMDGTPDTDCESVLFPPS